MQITRLYSEILKFLIHLSTFLLLILKIWHWNDQFRQYYLNTQRFLSFEILNHYIQILQYFEITTLKYTSFSEILHFNPHSFQTVHLNNSAFLKPSNTIGSDLGLFWSGFVWFGMLKRLSGCTSRPCVIESRNSSRQPNASKERPFFLLYLPGFLQKQRKWRMRWNKQVDR